MLRLGLRLSLNGGREALIRLALIAGAVAIGVTLLLAVLADFHGFQATSARQCWECTTGPKPTGEIGEFGAPVAGAALWSYGEDYYQGRTIRRLDVAALGEGAPVPPGITELPGADEYYASPALLDLLASTPPDQLADRFPAVQAGTIGDAALSGPDDLVIMAGATPRELAGRPATKQVTAIATGPWVDSAADLYRWGFRLVALGLLFPLLTLIGTATRLAAARREERFAAFRLAGATPRQVNVIASVEAVAGALVGTLAGFALFQPLRPALAGIAVTGARYFPDVVTPILPTYAAMLVGIPAAAAAAALWSLRRVRVSPLAASRRTTPPPPRAWRLLPLLIGLALFAVSPLVLGTQSGGGGLAAGGQAAGGQAAGSPSQAVLPYAFLAVLLVMLGLVMSGSWLTMQAARLVARSSGGASGLLAARRLADNPKAAFRSVSGLVLAVFVGTVIAGILPALTAGMQAGQRATLDNVLRASFVPVPSRPDLAGPAGAPHGGPDGGPDGDPGVGGGPGGPPLTQPVGLTPAAGDELLGELRSSLGVATLPVYRGPSEGADVTCTSTYGCAPTNGVVSCADLEQFSALGRCAPGAQAVNASFRNLLSSDNLAAQTLPVVDGGAEARPADFTGMRLNAILVKADDPATLERIRTLLTSYTAQAGAATAPKTFGEVAHARAILYDQIQRIAFAIVAVTLLIAGCALAVTVGGGLVERKRPFTLLRLAGTPARTLYRVVLLESAVPLLLTAAVAACAGFGGAVSIVDSLDLDNVSVSAPDHTYFLTLAGGLVASVAVILTALPLLRRITEPNNARFE
jgi:hypothetical protein